TTTAQNTKTLITQTSDLTAILAGALALTSLTWSGSVVTAVTAAPHNIPIGDALLLTIAGATPSGYNGTFLCTSTGTSGFTYPLVSNPGLETVPGIYTPEDVAELIAEVGTYFAQGSKQAVYVLEMGKLDVTSAVGILSAYLTANPGAFYAFLVPRPWDGNSAFLALIAQYEALTSKLYFFVTTTTGTYTAYTALMKSVFAMVEAPGVPSTEFTCAWPFYVLLSQAPSSTNK